MDLRAIVDRAQALFEDVGFESVRAWKRDNPGRPAIGHLPVYAPRELLHACGALPVGLAGGGDRVDIIKGDACFQSYICHIPRSTVEQGLRGDYDAFDGLVFPSTCDVIRNLSGIWELLFPEKMVHYLDLPQTFHGPGRDFYRRDLENLAAGIARVGGVPLSADNLARSIALYRRNREAFESVFALRAEAPELVPTPELYLVIRAGAVLPVDEHTRMLNAYLAACRSRVVRKEDRIRVVVVGSFCEQPPLGLLRTLERAGLYVVEDDFQLSQRLAPVDDNPDPLDALIDAYCRPTASLSTRWDEGRSRGDELVRTVRDRRADGVIFLAPSFCDPALLDQPRLQKALDAEHIPYTSFKYAENTGQFQGIHEQSGTFADSIKLWGEA